MKNLFVVMCCSLLVLFGLSLAQEKELLFTPNEVESMLFLYNQAPVKGDQVEIVAPVGAKLRKGLEVARAQNDSTKLVKLMMNPTELQICLNILNLSTFEARYAELVLGMKKKIEKLLPPPEPASIVIPGK